MKKKAIALFMTTLIFVLTLTSCGKDSGLDKGFTYPIDRDPVYLDTQIARDKGGLTIINNCFEGLVRMGENGEILPGVAESWKISSDGKKYTFRLREDARWFVTKAAGKTIGEDYEASFDTKVTAGDFVFAFRRAVDKATNAPYAQRLMCIKNARSINEGRMKKSALGVKATDDYTLVITLDYADDDFLSVLTTAICMPCNKEFFEMTGGRYGLSTAYLIYNGPFYISSWNEDTSVSLKRNTEYKGEYTATASGVYVSVNNEISTRGSKVSQGTYDLAPLTYEQYTELEGSKKLSFREVSDTVWGLTFNCRDPHMSSLNARLAICHGFDTSLMTESAYMTAEASGVIPSACTSSSLSYREKAKSADMLKYSTKKAEGYWAKALDELELNGMSITIKCSFEHENQLRAAIQNLQKTFGISCDARVSAMEEQELIECISSGDYQIAYAPIKATNDLAVDFLSRDIPDITGYSNSQYSALLKKVRAASGKERKKGLAAAEEFIINNAVILPVYEAKSYFGLAEGVEGIILSPTGAVADFTKAIRYE